MTNDIMAVAVQRYGLDVNWDNHTIPDNTARVST